MRAKPKTGYRHQGTGRKQDERGVPVGDEDRREDPSVRRAEAAGGREYDAEAPRDAEPRSNVEHGGERLGDEQRGDVERENSEANTTGANAGRQGAGR